VPDLRVLERALRKAFNMVREDASATARVVASAFRDDEEVNDEDLDKDLRSLFYTLEREQLLDIRRTEYKFEGQVRRAYFWRMKPLDRFPDEPIVQSISRDDLEAISVYHDLPPERWARTRPSA
jgi:hypothetical protein